MRNTSDLWEAIGDIEEEEIHHVLTRIFTFYETLLSSEPESREALGFFRNLDNALQQTEECNLNRR